MTALQGLLRRGAGAHQVSPEMLPWPWMQPRPEPDSPNNARAATVCTPTSTVGSPYAQDGAGDLCFQTASLCTYINSWSITTLEVNGTAYSNLYVASNTIAALNGVYIIHYVSANPWGHFESGGTCSTVSASNTPTQTVTRTSTAGLTTTKRALGK